MASSRKLRKKRLTARLIFLALCALFFFSASVAFFYIPFLNVKKIEIVSNGAVSVDLIKEKAAEIISRKIAGLFPRRNFFLIPEKEIKKEVEENFLRVKNAEVRKKIFSGLFIKIEERQNKAIVCSGQNCSFADENGFVFEKAPDFSEGIFLKIYDQRTVFDYSAMSSSTEDFFGKNILPKNDFSMLLNFSGLMEKIKTEPSKIILKNDNVYEVYTDENWRIILNGKNEPKRSLVNLAAALQSQIKENRHILDYVDLRFGNKVYYKYR